MLMFELLVFIVMRRPLSPLNVPLKLVELELITPTVSPFKLTVPLVVDALISARIESSKKIPILPLVDSSSRTPKSGRIASQTIFAFEVSKLLLSPIRVTSVTVIAPFVEFAETLSVPLRLLSDHYLSQ
jgi:hypothetical protein